MSATCGCGRCDWRPSLTAGNLGRWGSDHYAGPVFNFCPNCGDRLLRHGESRPYGSEGCKHCGESGMMRDAGYSYVPCESCKPDGHLVSCPMHGAVEDDFYHPPVCNCRPGGETEPPGGYADAD